MSLHVSTIFIVVYVAHEAYYCSIMLYYVVLGCIRLY